MTSTPLPLDIISVIIREIEFGTKSDYSEILSTLKSCSLLCRAWRDLAQRRLLRKVAFGEEPSFFSRNTPPPQPDFKGLAVTAQKNPTLVSYIRVLSLAGRSILADADFPQILELIVQAGELRSFSWNVGCCDNCLGWYGYSELHRRGIEAVLKIPKLTSVRLLQFCQEFPLEMIGYSRLVHVELQGSSKILSDFQYLRHKRRFEPLVTPAEYGAGSRIKLKSLKLGGFAENAMKRYLGRQDFRLDFSGLEELIIDGLHSIDLVNLVLERCLSTITSLTLRRYRECDLRSRDHSVKVRLSQLPNLRVLNIESFAGCADLWFNHVVLPNCLETLNIAIEYGKDYEKPASKIDQEELYDVEDLVGVIARAKESLNGRLKEVNMYHLLHGYTEALRVSRMKVEREEEEEASIENNSDREDDDKKMEQVEEWATAAASSLEEAGNQEVRSEIARSVDYDTAFTEALSDMSHATSPWLRRIDSTEGKARNQGARSEHNYATDCYVIWKYLPVKVAAWYAECLGTVTDIVKCHVLDYNDRPRREWGHDTS